MCSHSSQPSRKEICIRNRLHSVSFCLLTVFDQNTGKRVILVKVGALNHLQSGSVGFIEFEHPKALLFSESPCHSLDAPQREARAVVDVHHCCQVAADRKVGSSLLPSRTGLSHAMALVMVGMFLVWCCVCMPDLRCIIDGISMGIPQYSTLLFESIQFFTILYYTSSFSFSSFRWSINLDSFGISCFELLFIPPLDTPAPSPQVRTNNSPCILVGCVGLAPRTCWHFQWLSPHVQFDMNNLHISCAGCSEFRLLFGRRRCGSATWPAWSKWQLSSQWKQPSGPTSFSSCAHGPWLV